MSYPGLLNDVMFKIVFGSQQNEAVLIALINALLDLRGACRIQGLEILSPGAEKVYLSEKGPILDLKARDEAGKQYNVEVQLRPGLVDYVKRSLFYAAKLYCGQLQTGHDYDLLRRTVSISILDFELFPTLKVYTANSSFGSASRSICSATIWSFTISSYASSPQTNPTSFEHASRSGFIP